MAESRHGTGSANLVSNSRKGGTKNSLKCKKENKKKFFPIAAIVWIIFVFAILKIKNYADQNNCSSAFWNYISDIGIQLLGGGSIADGIISGICTYIGNEKTDLKNLVKKFVKNFIIIMGMIMIIASFFIFSKVKGAINEQKEKDIEEVQEENDAETGNIVSLESDPQNNKKTVIKYKINQDLYMSDRPLSDYYIGEILEENENAVRAEILFNNLEQNIPTGSKSENYNKLLETADMEYDTYIYQRKRDKNNETENDDLFSDRIEMLQKSLDRRKEANNECEDPENERLLANGYKDMGDEYFGRHKQNDAIIAYEEGVEWYMKAIYHAAAKSDYDEMEKSMDLLKKLEKEVEKLDEIDSDRRLKIRTFVEVYDIFVRKIMG